ncbi:Leucine-rich repeat-containing protein 56 [Phytophthora boehmeriae]|uniref:Leucine-rich repeat-containing protein 56 n=1 Tax=Phytophthora boehmeriae TaxID=109152 RepID=A0A8T1VKF5_9STRA|nr:Leucine-rich repeat-containing protein 56 [Phytophthora boehmeriae]
MSSRPDTPKEQQDNPFDDITEEKLKKMSGSQDLGRVTTLQISVDSSKQSVEVIGELLPSLQQLRLQQSSLSSFRDLGTSLRSLRVLWAMHCNIADLDGIGALTNLQELYLQHNNVSDISPLTMHEELRIIDLEGNNITDIGQIEQLAFCPQLVSLNLTGNPVEAIDRYRHIIENFLPQLMSLDDRAFTDSERVKLTDQEIDAAILKHRTGLQTEVPSSKRPCSPIKTSRGIFTTATSSKNALGRTDEWHLDVLSSKVDITTARRHVPTSLTSKQQRERSLIASADGNSDSDSDDESSGCPVVAVESSSPQAVPKTAFFNVAESLTAIEKWRDEMEYDAEDTAVVNVVSLQLCLSPRAVTPSMSENANSSNPSGGHAVTSNQQDSPVQGQQNKNRALGPANHDTDQTIIQLLREKQGQLKTRDGFRAYFRGIEEARLDIILRQVFADSDRVQRRMQIMSGLFRHEL